MVLVANGKGIESLVNLQNSGKIPKGFPIYAEGNYEEMWFDDDGKLYSLDSDRRERIYLTEEDKSSIGKWGATLSMPPTKPLFG